MERVTHADYFRTAEYLKQNADNLNNKTRAHITEQIKNDLNIAIAPATVTKMITELAIPIHVFIKRKYKQRSARHEDILTVAMAIHRVAKELGIELPANLKHALNEINGIPH